MTDRHPTSVALLQTAVALLDERAPDEVTVELVLSTSGVSKGSLYHHYRDFNDLLDRAQVSRFGRLVDASIAMLTEVVTTAATREEFYAGLVSVTAATQGSATAGSRALRIWTLAQAALRPTMRTALGTEQQRLTDSLTDLAREAQEKGWFRADLDPAAVAVFIQAYTLGKAVDDVAPQHVDQRAWESLVNTVVATVFLAEPVRAVDATGAAIPSQPDRTTTAPA
jgi:AcrR family transcriptional regulator